MKEIMAMIPSQTVRDFVKDEGMVFSDRQKASMIYHSQSITKWKDRKALLQHIMKHTSDEELKREIIECIERDDAIYANFQQNIYRRYIYILTIEDHYCGKYREDYFSDFDLAWDFGRKTGSNYRIEKRRIKTDPDSEDYLATAYFDAYEGSGDLIRICEDQLLDLDDYKRFEHCFCIVPNPYCRGDIVYVREFKKYGIVDTSYKQWMAMKSKIETFGRNEKGDIPTWDDAKIRISVVDRNGEFYKVYANPINVEKHVPSNFEGDYDYFDKVLIAASALYNGCGSLDDLHEAQKEYQSFMNHTLD